MSNVTFATLGSAPSVKYGTIGTKIIRNYQRLYVDSGTNTDRIVMVYNNGADTLNMTSSDILIVNGLTITGTGDDKISSIASYLSAFFVEASGIGGSWVDSQIITTNEKPIPDDQFSIAWATNYTTALSSPVQVAPAICNTGAQITGSNAQSDTNILFAKQEYRTNAGANNDLSVWGEIKPGGDAQAARWPVIFSVTINTAVLEIGLYTSGTVLCMVEVNGRMASDVAFYRPSTVTGSATKFTLTFPGASTRIIKIYMPGSCGLVAVRTTTGGTITKPSAVQRRIAIIGDSYVNGSGSGNGFPDQGAQIVETFAPRLLRMIGADEIILAGIGGTGWTTANNYESRIAKVLSFTPNEIVFYGSVNDGTTNAGLYAAVVSALALVTDVTRVTVIGPLLKNYEVTNGIVKLATISSGRAFVDLGTFINGSGKVTAPNGSGNSDFFLMSDGVHPTLAGHRAIANRAFALYANQFWK